MLGVLNDHNFCERSPPTDGDTTDDVDVDPPSTCHGTSNNNDELDRLLAEATTRREEDSCGEDVCMLQLNNAYHEMECGPVMIGGEVSLSNSRYNDIDESPLTSPSTPPSQAMAVKVEEVEEEVELKPIQTAPVAKPVKKAKRKELSEKEKYYRLDNQSQFTCSARISLEIQLF